MKTLRPVHPGDILLKDFLKPIDLKPCQLAKRIGVAAPTINELVHRRKWVTAQTAIRLARFFGTTPELWTSLQSQYDLEIARRRIGKMVIETITPREPSP